MQAGVIPCHKAEGDGECRVELNRAVVSDLYCLAATIRPEGTVGITMLIVCECCSIDSSGRVIITTGVSDAAVERQI